MVIGENTNYKDYWESLEGEITQTPPESQIDSFTISFDPQNIMPGKITPTNPNYNFDEVIIYLNELNQTLKSNEIALIITNLNKAKQFYSDKNLGRLKSTLELVHNKLFNLRKKVDDQNKAKILYAVAKLEKLYSNSLTGYNTNTNLLKLYRRLEKQSNTVSPLEDYLYLQKSKGKTNTTNALILQEIKNRIEQMNIGFNNLNQTEILLKSNDELIKEVR